MKNRNRRARRLLLLAAAFAVAAGAWLLGARQEGDYAKVAGAPAPTAEHTTEPRSLDTPQAKPEPDESGAQGATDEPLQPATPATPAATVPLPVDYGDIPVVELLDRLGERARAGDPKASCELATALHTCRFSSLARTMIRPPPPPDASESELERYVEFHAAFQERRERDKRRCAGVEPAALLEAVHFTATSALAGHVDSLLRFMPSPAMHSAQFLRDPRLADLYRTQLWPTLRRGFAAGNVELANAVLTELSFPVDSPLLAALPEAYRDQEVASALLSLTVGESEAPNWSAAAQLPPTPAAMQSARRWVDDLFGGRVPDLSKANLARVRDASPRRGSNCDSASAWLPR